jgi:hypothetical protein
MGRDISRGVERDGTLHVNSSRQAILPKAMVRLDSTPSQESNEVVRRLTEVESSLNAINDLLKCLLQNVEDRIPRKEYFTISEFAQLIGRAPFTVREWARHLRVRTTRAGARGPYAEYRIHISEIARYRSEGLLPQRRHGRQSRD